MINFKIIKKSKKSRARLGFLKTSHGEIETPALVPVATQAVVKTLTSEEVVRDTKTQILISNTFHLHLKPGEEVVKKAGGLHKFMNWQGPIMTDSGGFQVFSLGFGHDLKIGKLLKYFPGEGDDLIKVSKQPKHLKITETGVVFRSPIDGRELFIGPKESIEIQKKLGADIIFSFDECTAPLSSYKYVQQSLIKTHKWAKICRDMSLEKKQALFGIIQGSKYKDLREESAKYINSLDFSGHGIGGDLGANKQQMKEIISWALSYLEETKPRHLLGIGYLEDINNIIEWGIDLFDCTVPTHYARRGIVFTSNGKINLNQSQYLGSKQPLDVNCSCSTCLSYRKNYISHLIRAKETTGMKLLTIHNLYYFNSFVEKIRQKIKKGLI